MFHLKNQTLKVYNFFSLDSLRFATVKKTSDLCQETLLKESISIRIIFKLLDKFASSFQALKDAQIHHYDI